MPQGPIGGKRRNALLWQGVAGFQRMHGLCFASIGTQRRITNQMNEKSSKSRPHETKRGKAREAARRAKQSALLRENLLKRKAQMRERTLSGKSDPGC